MSGASQAVFMNHRSFALPLPAAIGAPFGGGFFAGQISVNGDGVATHNLVVGPLSTAEIGATQWKTTLTSTPGTDSVIDGPTNTAAMITAGAAAHPGANFCNNLVVGGFSDWYLPAQNEVEVCYFNLKPGTDNNWYGSGINPNAVPARASNYTDGDPARTTALIFRTGSTEPFATVSYWSSTQNSVGQASLQHFRDGEVGSDNKNLSRRVRAIRRVPV